MHRIHKSAQALLELSWWVHRKGPLRSGLEPLPATERAVLRYVQNNEGCSVIEVATSMDIKSSNVSAAVRSLVKRELLEKSDDPLDKRKSLLHLTELAHTNRKSIDAAITGSLEEVLERLSPEHRESLFASLDALRDVVVRLRSH